MNIINNEIWKIFIGSKEYYEISSYGRIRSKRDNVLLQQYTDKKGRPYVACRIGDIFKNYYVDKLVANVFVDNPEGYKYIIHKDMNLVNNRFNNLRWVEYRSALSSFYK